MLTIHVIVIGYGKAVYGMAVELNKQIGKHIVEGIITVPKGLLQEHENVLSESTIRFAFHYLKELPVAMSKAHNS